MRSHDFFTYIGGAHLKSKLTEEEEEEEKSLRESLIEVGAHLKIKENWNVPARQKICAFNSYCFISKFLEQ